MNKQIQVSAHMRIRQGKLEEFKRHAGAIIAQAKAKDPGTLRYDWFLSRDKTECEVREAYECSEALLAHVLNVRELIGTLFDKYASDHAIVIYGDPSPEILQKTSPMALRSQPNLFFNPGVDGICWGNVPFRDASQDILLLRIADALMIRVSNFSLPFPLLSA